MSIGNFMPKISSILAIDPGISGAVAYVERSPKGVPLRVCLQDIITREHDGSPLLDLARMQHELGGLPAPDLVLFEEPLALYAQRGKVTTSARTLKVSLINYGRLQTLVELVFGITDWYSVAPSTWKSVLRLSSDKQESLQLARLLFPLATDLLKRKRDHDRAEALLLAEYAHWHLLGAA